MFVEIKCSKSYITNLLITSCLLNVQFNSKSAQTSRRKKLQVLTLSDHIFIFIFQIECFVLCQLFCFSHSIDICTVTIKNIRNMQAFQPIKFQILCILTARNNINQKCLSLKQNNFLQLFKKLFLRRGLGSCCYTQLYYFF